MISRALVLDRVAGCPVVACVVDIVNGGCAPAIGHERPDVVDYLIVLPAKAQTTIGTFESDIRLPTKFTATLTEFSAIEIKAVFEPKERLVAAAEILRSEQSPLGTNPRTTAHAVRRGSARIVNVRDCFVYLTI